MCWGWDQGGGTCGGGNLGAAILMGANLRDADLVGAELPPLAVAMTRVLPAGTIEGWKKCNGGVLVRLSIPADCPRSNAFGRKCRAAYADVLEVIGAEFGVTSTHGPRTEYRVGERVTADSWDEDWIDECSHGIHFFITREEAEAYR